MAFKSMNEKPQPHDSSAVWDDAFGPITEEYLLPEHKSGPAHDIVEALHQNQDCFLTGGGGVGKTWNVGIIKKHPTIQAVTLASTGVAANLVHGQTVHRFFNLGISNNLKELKAWDRKNARQFGEKIDKTPQAAHQILMGLIRKNLAHKNLIIIDEVSMLSAEVIEMIHYRLNKCVKQEINILYVGDFYQLAPVEMKGEPNMAFESPYWKVKVFELGKIQRTKNLEFAEIQHRIRYGESSPEVINYLKALEGNEYDPDSLHLFSTNKEIDNYNIKKLRELPGKPQRVAFRYDDNKYKEKDCQKFIKDLLVNETLYFKFGAKVLFVSNNYDLDGHLIWYNGEIGTLVSFHEGAFTVLKDDGETVTVPRVDFTKEEMKNGIMREVISIQQFPLRIAYAISIHKSQGLSLPSGHIDCSNFFLNEQFFVAISRFIDPSRLSLVGFDPSLIKQNMKAKRYYESESIRYYD